MHIVELISTGDRYSGNTKRCRNNVCVGCTERMLVVSSLFFLFVLCSASVSGLQIVFSNKFVCKYSKMGDVSDF